MIRISVNVEESDSLYLDALVDAANADPNTPPQARRLLNGADTIEVSQVEADEILDWLGRVSAWTDAPKDRKPLLWTKGSASDIWSIPT